MCDSHLWSCQDSYQLDLDDEVDDNDLAEAIQEARIVEWAAFSCGLIYWFTTTWWVQVEAGLQGDEDTVAGSTWIHVNLKPKGGLNP